MNHLERKIYVVGVIGFKEDSVRYSVFEEDKNSKTGIIRAGAIMPFLRELIDEGYDLIVDKTRSGEDRPISQSARNILVQEGFIR